jgi:hypothetical protein
MTQGAMRVEEYERHFIRVMLYAPKNTNTDQKKQFWFLRGLHHGLRQGLKEGEHNSLRHLVIRVVVLKDERKGREDHIKDRKRMGDRDHFDRSSQRPRDGPTNMMRGNFRSGINQYGSNFGGGNNYYSGGGSFNYRQQNGGYNRPWPSTPRSSTGGIHPDLLRLWQAWAQVLPVPRQEDRSYARKSTDPRRRTSSAYSSAICEPWEAYLPEGRISYRCFYHRDRRVLSWIASALTLFDAEVTRFFYFLISSKNRESALNLGDEILVRGGVL